MQTPQNSPLNTSFCYRFPWFSATSRLFASSISLLLCHFSASPPVYCFTAPSWTPIISNAPQASKAPNSSNFSCDCAAALTFACHASAVHRAQKAQTTGSDNARVRVMGAGWHAGPQVAVLCFVHRTLNPLSCLPGLACSRPAGSSADRCIETVDMANNPCTAGQGHTACQFSFYKVRDYRAACHQLSPYSEIAHQQALQSIAIYGASGRVYADIQMDPPILLSSCESLHR